MLFRSSMQREDERTACIIECSSAGLNVFWVGGSERSGLVLSAQLSPLEDGGVELVEHVDGGLPADAAVGNRDAVLELVDLAVLGLALLALVEMRLDHDTGDGVLAVLELLGDGVDHLGLVAEVLVRVAVRAVDHDRRVAIRESGLELGFGGLNGGCVKVGAFGATAVDDVEIGVADSTDDGSEALFGDTHEGVGLRRGTNGVDRDTEAAVGTILEADRHREAGDKLAVQLGLGGTRTDGTPRVEVGGVLRRDGVEHLTGDGDALGGEVDEEVAGDLETAVDLEAAVDVRVVDETLPANGGAGLLKVGAHDDDETLRPALVDALLEQLGVLLGLVDVVDGAGTHDNEQAVVLTVDDGTRLATCAGDGELGFLGHGDLVQQERGRDQWLEAGNTDIVDVGVLVGGATLEDGLRERLSGATVGRVGSNARHDTKKRRGCSASEDDGDEGRR